MLADGPADEREHAGQKIGSWLANWGEFRDRKATKREEARAGEECGTLADG